VLQAARDEIWASWRRTCDENADHPRAKELFDRQQLPAFHDPFAGGGALPLEAQRLGLESHASDLNPVAVLINKAMIEIPPKFAEKPPVNPDARQDDSLFARKWRGAQGLAEDVRHYGQWMRDEAEKRIGHLYPKVEVTADMAKDRPDLKAYIGRKLTVIAWLWARTVKSPNPAFANVDVPLASTFMLSTKKGKEAYVQPVIENGGYRFTVKIGKPSDSELALNGTKLSRGANFRCLMSGAPISSAYVKAEGKAGRMGTRLLGIVADGGRKRIYLSPTPTHEEIAQDAAADWKPEVEISGSTQYLGVKPYGIERFDQLFTDRQTNALNTLANLVHEVRERVVGDARTAGLPASGVSLNQNGGGAAAYAEAVCTYLGLAVSKLSDYNGTLVQWSKSRDQAVHVFGRQALPMVWDFAEINPFGGAAGDLITSLAGISRTVDVCGRYGDGSSVMADAQSQELSRNCCVSTDPPYYDNVPYADLSDYFYVWMRRALQPTFSDLFATVAAPKAEELVAFAYRHGGKQRAEEFFLEGMAQAMRRLAEQTHPAFPVTIYYAFKQAEVDNAAGTASTGWETFLDAVIRAGFAIGGTWPVRTEKPGRMRENNSNALASSIVLVCRKRAAEAPTATRREFVNALKAELPQALAHLQRGNIAPVDLAQAAIGPGMAVYTRYAKVLDAEGKPLRVRDALALINQTLDEALAEQEGDFDSDSRWALTWFEQSGFDEGEYGVAETLATARNTSVSGLDTAGVVESKRGKVRLLRPEELPNDWDPATDPRLTAWETVHHLIRVLASGGEGAAAGLVAKLGAKAETARELAYRLYVMSERKKRVAEALAYNGLVQSWAEIQRLAQSERTPAAATQARLLGED